MYGRPLFIEHHTFACQNKDHSLICTFIYLYVLSHLPDYKCPETGRLCLCILPSTWQGSLLRILIPICITRNILILTRNNQGFAACTDDCGVSITSPTLLSFWPCLFSYLGYLGQFEETEKKKRKKLHMTTNPDMW